MSKTLFDKIWDDHVVKTDQNLDHEIVYIDLQLLHEVTSPQAFNFLRNEALPLRHPNRHIATADHVVPTVKENGRLKYYSDKEVSQVNTLEANCNDFNVDYYSPNNKKQGIIHIIAPEQGLIQPGMTVVCGDSHTSTHGAFGAYAFGIGTTEVANVMATQCLIQKKPKNMKIHLNGELNYGVTAKDVILYIISKIGTKGGTGHVIEYTGKVFENMTMEERMTVCNMSIEAGAKAGMISPDETTFTYLSKCLPEVEYQSKHHDWKYYVSDEDANFDTVFQFSAADIFPMLTFGTNPESSISINQTLPATSNLNELDYMGFNKSQSLQHHKIDMVFVGSCTNGRLEDIKLVADTIKNKTVANHVTFLVVPGSQKVKADSERLGYDKIIMDAGGEWREPGCSLCLGMNGDTVPQYKYCVSTSNRNFKGRQGENARTILASPLMATHAAIHGEIIDYRSSNVTS